MFWSNYHSHSTFCDGRSPMEEFVKFAIAKGIRKYGFSSHAPLPFHTQWTMNPDDYPDYEAEFYRLKQKYASEIDLYLGLEVDYIEGCTDARKPFFSEKKFDYLIGSIHYLDQISEDEYWSIDGPFDEFEHGLNLLFGGDIRRAAKRFFEVSAKMIENGGFDLVGHVDKITYHGQKISGFDPTASWFASLEKEILQLIREKGLILEINTKALHDHGMTFPHQHFYPLIREMKIPVTVNSDCHYPTKVTDGFEITYQRLKRTGFKTVQQLTEKGWMPLEFNEQGVRL